MTGLPLSFATDTATIRFPRVTKDARNNAVRVFDADAPAPVEISGCLLQPGASVEVLGGRDVASDVWTLYLPADAEIDETCQVEVDGVAYAVDGLPAHWTKMTVANKVAILKRWR